MLRKKKRFRVATKKHQVLTVHGNASEAGYPVCRFVQSFQRGYELSIHSALLL